MTDKPLTQEELHEALKMADEANQICHLDYEIGCIQCADKARSERQFIAASRDLVPRMARELLNAKENIEELKHRLHMKDTVMVFQLDQEIEALKAQAAKMRGALEYYNEHANLGDSQGRYSYGRARAVLADIDHPAGGKEPADKGSASE